MIRKGITFSDGSALTPAVVAKNYERFGHGDERLRIPVHAQIARGFDHVEVDDDIVTVKSEAGEIKVPVEITDAIKPGVVSMPHGWGHGKPGTRMSVANNSPGANTNALSPPTFIDEPSGNGALNGIPVTVIGDRVRSG